MNEHIRRLIVCFDGTWNDEKGGKATNIVKMVRAITNTDAHGTCQFVFYNKGVGTAGSWASRVVEGAFGGGLNDNLIEGYRFLANNYLPGDEIYIFGFSRGAYTARSLAGFVACGGLFSPADLGGKLDQAVDVYRSDVAPAEKKVRMADLRGDRGHPDVRIRCVGVWDTVGALGVPAIVGLRSSKYSFHDVQLSNKVDVALHALAIDEKRRPFMPTLWVRKERDLELTNQVVEQVWFPGVHSNIGGGYTDAGLADASLDWLISRVAAETELAFDAGYLKEAVAPNALGAAIESRTMIYPVSKALPRRRMIGARFLSPPHAMHDDNGDDVVPRNEMLHISSLERWGKLCVTDEKEGGTKTSVYEPDNLRVVIEAAALAPDTAIPVVGWDGRILQPGTFQWPAKAL